MSLERMPWLTEGGRPKGEMSSDETRRGRRTLVRSEEPVAQHEDRVADLGFLVGIGQGVGEEGDGPHRGEGIDLEDGNVDVGGRDVEQRGLVPLKAVLGRANAKGGSRDFELGIEPRRAPVLQQLLEEMSGGEDVALRGNEHA